jgi:aminoglycoside 3'-phosphotransferase-2
MSDLCAVRLGRAATLIETGEIDPREFSPRNRQRSPRALLESLTRRKPSEDVVVVHGDATLSNMVISSDLSVAFIDCGHAGRADPYVDLALVAEGLAGRFGATTVDDFMKAYGGATLDKEKARYFLDLYELF